MHAVCREPFVTSVDVCNREGEVGLTRIADVRLLSPAFRMDVLDQLKVVGRTTARLAWNDELGNLEVGVLIPNQTTRIGVCLFLDKQQLES
jgi:hypothetical protein